MVTRKLAVAVAATVALFGSQAQAAFIVGSTSFDLVNVTTSPTASSLDTASSIAFSSLNVNANRTGNYTAALTTGAVGSATQPVAFSGTAVGSTLVTPYPTFNFGGGNTFTATSGSITSRVISPFSSLNIGLFGTVNFAGFDPTPGLLTIALSQSGGPGANNTLSGSGTLISPFGLPTPTPAPAAALVAGLGAVGLAGFRRVRRS